MWSALLLCGTPISESIHPMSYNRKFDLAHFSNRCLKLKVESGECSSIGLPAVIHLVCLVSVQTVARCLCPFRNQPLIFLVGQKWYVPVRFLPSPLCDNTSRFTACPRPDGLHWVCCVQRGSYCGSACFHHQVLVVAIRFPITKFREICQ